MSVISPPTASIYQPPPYPVRKFSVDEYHRMIEIGLLTEDDPVELLEEWIVLKMPRNPPHDTAIRLLQKALDKMLPAGWDTRGQSAITLADSEPEPDMVVVGGDTRDFSHRHPEPQDIAIIIEVADSSLDRDRNDKGRIYARAGIAIYWIINLIDRQVEVYAQPSGTGTASRYQQRQDCAANAAVPLVIAGQSVGQIAVQDLLP